MPYHMQVEWGSRIDVALCFTGDEPMSSLRVPIKPTTILHVGGWILLQRVVAYYRFNALLCKDTRPSDPTSKGRSREVTMSYDEDHVFSHSECDR